MHFACFSLAILFGVTATLRSEPFTFTAINPPFFPEGSTIAGGINNAGEVVGYVRLSGPGYLLTADKFTMIGIAGDVTFPFDINDVGEIVGTYGRSGFLLGGGVFTRIDFPSATFTGARSINDAGQILGIYSDPRNGLHGFLLSEGVFTTIDFPEAKSTAASGINNAGQIVGSYSDVNGVSHGFLLSGGVFTTIDFPGALNSYAAGLNNTGHIVGGSFVNDDYRAFLFTSGTFTSIEYPDVFNRSTRVRDINDSGQIVGDYNVGPFGGSGFIASGIPEPASLILLVLGALFISIAARVPGCTLALQGKRVAPSPMAKSE